MTKQVSYALCGNPNCGKTTLFNLLTGSNQKVGNWPGVTVEQKRGVLKADKNITVTDTPGIYSLTPFTADEKVAHSYLTTQRPDVIINVVDATCLARSLYLTVLLTELHLPMVVALNMQDEARAKGIRLDVAKLSHYFGCHFVEISAAKNEGIDKLLQCCKTATPPVPHLPPVPIDAATLAAPADAEPDTTADTPDELSARRRHQCIAQIVADTLTTGRATQKELAARKVTQRIDSIVLNKWAAFPIFALTLSAVFYLSIDGLGGWLSSLLNTRLTPLLQDGARNLIAAAWLRSLVADGIIAGVMSVVSFVPQVMLLFGFIAVLEACGYMSRIAFITDRLLAQIGLGGRSFVSMVLGCGCSVPAIMATRTIKNVDERNTTITLTPFMPCSAKLAVISFFTANLLGGNALFAISFYFLSIFAVILGGLAVKIFADKDDAGNTFFLELPNYRRPTVKNVTKQMWERGKAFVVKAGTVIFCASVILWAMQNFNWRMQQTDAENSMLASLSKAIAPLFYPLGFDDCGCGWQLAIATVSGIAAKETVVTTLQILLPQGIENCVSPLGAYSFVAYNLLTVPCVAAISASFAEQGVKKGLSSILFQVVTAYAVSLAIYQMGTLAHMYTSAFVTTLCCAAIATILFACVRSLAKHKGCASCRKNCPQHRN